MIMWSDFKLGRTIVVDYIVGKQKSKQKQTRWSF